MDKLTHRTCRATAPSVLSLFVNRSVGNSCRAGREREKERDRDTHTHKDTHTVRTVPEYSRRRANKEMG